MLAYPYFIELVHRLLHDFRIISQYASLEIASRLCFHTDSGSCEVRTSNIHLFAVKDKHLEMDTRTKHSFQAVIQHRIFVKVLSKVRAWFFCMN